MAIYGLTKAYQQWTLTGLVAIGTLAGLAGGILSLLPVTARLGVFLGNVAMVFLVGAIAWARETKPLEILHQRATGGGLSRQARNFQLLRIFSILLNFLVIVAIVLLMLEIFILTGAPGAPDATLIALMSGGTASVMAAALGGSLFQSLRTEYPIEKSSVRTMTSILLLSGGFILVGAAAGFIGSGFAQAAILAGEVFIAIAAIAWRNLPTLYTLLTEDKGARRAGGRQSATQSTFVPILGAFGLLFLVFLLFMIFGANALGAIDNVLADPSFLFLIAIIVLAIVGSIGSVFFLGRQKEELELFQKVVDPTQSTRRIIIYSSAGAAAFLMLIGAMIYFEIAIFDVRQGRWIDFVTAGMMAALAPYGFYAAREHGRVRRLEERFPDFLRDIASSHRGGLTLPAAVRIAARGEYGPLSEEVQRMADQMTWNVPFSEALQRFADRVATPLVLRTVSLVQEASRSGGSTSDVLLAAARDARQIKNMETERRLSMTLYGVIIYITFSVFLLVAAVMHQQFVPQIIASSEALAQSGIPGGMQISVVTLDEYRAFYYLASTVQGIGGGIVAGMMADGKAVLGLRHSAIMTFISFVTFSLFLV